MNITEIEKLILEKLPQGYKINNNKLYNPNGEVAVAVSRGYGAGWSSWCAANPMDYRYNILVLIDNYEVAHELAKLEDYYTGGLDDVELCWIEPGCAFVIDEYDGSEGIQFRDNEKWNIT